MLKRITASLIIAGLLSLSACDSGGNDASSETVSVSSESSTVEISTEESSQEESSMIEETKPVLDGSNLVVFGDSLTALGSWGESVAEELNMYYFNGAMGGITSAQGLGRFPAFVANREPDFVTLCFGMNDMLMTAADTPKVSIEQFKKNLLKMVEMVRELGAVPIIVTTNPLVNDVFFASQGQDSSLYANIGTPLEWLDKYNEAAREVAKESDCLLADVRKACDAYTPKEVDAPDGIHLSALGNRIFTETVSACLTAAYERDTTVGKVERHKYVLAEGEKADIISFNGTDWYTPEERTMVFSSKDGILKISNTNGLWPDGQYVPSTPVAANVESSSLHIKLFTSGAGASLLLYFGYATPSAYTDGKYAVINPHLGVETDSYTGDIKPNQSCDVTIPLSSLNLPASCFNEEGLLIFSGVKLYVAGSAYQPVTVEALEIVENTEEN